MPSKEDLKEQQKVVDEIRKKAGHLIDRYLAAAEPETDWIKSREGLSVSIAMELTKAAMEKYGEDAKELLAKIMYDHGYRHGKEMAARVLARGGDLDDLRELDKEFERDYKIHHPFYGREVSKKRYVMRIPACHMGNALTKIYPSLPESLCSSKYWCDLDYGTRDGYNPKIKLSRPKWIAGGDLYCEYVWELEE